MFFSETVRDRPMVKLPLADLGIEAGQCPLPSPPLPHFLFHPIPSSLTLPSFPLPLVQLGDLGRCKLPSGVQHRKFFGQAGF